jgi:hypothetical protein
MTARILGLALLLALGLGAQRRAGQSNIAVAVPPDPHELVTGTVPPPAAGARGTAMELLQQARQNGRLQISGTAPYRMDVTFTADGESGRFTQIWLAPQTWRWTASLGAASMVRGMTPEAAYADSGAPVPMRIAMLREAIFDQIYDVAIGTQLRTAAATVNGKPATCALTSGVATANYSGRLWEELEYCFDNATGLLVSASFAPGVFTTYSYSGRTFHGHSVPEHLTTYVAGNAVLDASVQIADAATDPASLAPPPGMAARATVLVAPARMPLPLPAPSGIAKVSPVLVHANLVDGKVADAEVCAASDPSLAVAALEQVKRVGGRPGTQQVYFAVKFLPGTN